MLNRIIFFCHYGAGDIFESREFAREYVRILGTTDNYYAHGKSPYILNDMKDFKFTEVTPEMHHRVPWKVVGDTIYINMWIGRDSKYVLPQIGVVVEKLFEMHNDMLRSMGVRQLSRSPYAYIPIIDYSQYVTTGVDSFIKNAKWEKLILISNGPVQSCQAENFDFTPVIELLCKTFPKYQFVVTQRTNLVAENLAYTDDIIGISTGTDLNEISYLSTFCDVCIGRNSGPHVFAQVLDNWSDKNKVSLSFTYAKRASHFVLSDSLLMKKEWSNVVDTQGVFEKVCKVIK